MKIRSGCGILIYSAEQGLISSDDIYKHFSIKQNNSMGHSVFFFKYVFENIRLGISCDSAALICMKYQGLFSLKIQKKIQVKG